MEWNSEAVSTLSPISGIIDPEEVRRMYWEEGLSIRVITERLGVSGEAILRCMYRHNIPRRSLLKAQALSKGSGRRKPGGNGIVKLCWRCGKLKPVKEFHRNVAHYDGLASHCKQCCQESRLGTIGKHYNGLHKRPFPLDGRCELCGIELNPMRYDSHHFDDGNINLTISLCDACDFLAEGLDEIERNLWKVDTYRKLKKGIEEAEKVYIYLGPFKPSDGVHRLYSSNGQLTHKWCPHCGKMKSVNKFYRNCCCYDSLYKWCKECSQSYTIGNHNKDRTRGLHKPIKTNSCEFCGANSRQLDSHHWDDNNKSKVIYLCKTNKCHHLAEAVDLIDSGSLLPEKYYELKQRIILEDINNTRIANLEKRVTLLEAENILLEKQEVLEYGDKE